MKPPFDRSIGLRRYRALLQPANWLKALRSGGRAIANILRAAVFLPFSVAYRHHVQRQLSLVTGDAQLVNALIETLGKRWRRYIRWAAGARKTASGGLAIEQLVREIRFLSRYANVLSPTFQALSGKRVLFSGQSYYHAWYLSRGLRPHGWKADLLNWDANPASQIYYHGQDFYFGGQDTSSIEYCLEFYVDSLYAYDVFHFSNTHGISFGQQVASVFSQWPEAGAEICLLKNLGKKIVYSHTGCLDGVSQTAFSRWGPESVCSICRWRNEPSVCSDESNLKWGKFRNSLADYQCTGGGNRVDYNDDPRVHEAPEFFCLDPEIWNPQLDIPARLALPPAPAGTVRLYHAVGNKLTRTSETGVNIKSSHIYLPLIDKLRDGGVPVELIAPTGVPNLDVRFLQMQSDIVLEMLTYGWFGANAREAMMLGKPVICYIRPEWLESVREEIPDYAAELPVISATPQTVEGILRDLIANPEKRREIGARSRAFALKWHSKEAAGRRYDQIYSALIKGEPLLRAKA